MKRVAVVGSGPAGTWCAHALVARGIKPVILDAGERLDESRQAVVDRLARMPPNDWSADDLGVVTANPTVRDRAVPKKLAFGSDFVYGGQRDHSPLVAPTHGSAPTYALGGYSTVWGGAMLPIAAQELDGWPLGVAALEPHYRAVLARVPLAAAHDGLESEFPLFVEPQSLAPPQQGRSLLSDLAAAGDRLGAAGIVAGRARLAVQSGPSAGGCMHCGLCLSGCPVGAIYWSGRDIEDLVGRGDAEYHRAVVTAVREVGQEVEVEMLDPTSRERSAVRFDHVFLAAGAINTTRILLRSRPDRGTTATLLDSQKFVLPLIRRRAEPTAAHAPGNVLATAFIEINDPTVSRRWVHVQVSPMNRLLLERLRVTEHSWRARLLAPLLTRLMVCLGSLNPDESGRVELSLQGGSPNGILHVRKVASVGAKAAAQRVASKLARVSHHFGAFVPPVSPTIAEIGVSAHIGGSFPMQPTPTKHLSSDVFGRPAGARRIFITDSSAFPSVPGTTVALTIMANAHRIGSEAPFEV